MKLFIVNRFWPTEIARLNWLALPFLSCFKFLFHIIPLIYLSIFSTLCDCRRFTVQCFRLSVSVYPVHVSVGLFRSNDGSFHPENLFPSCAFVYIHLAFACISWFVYFVILWRFKICLKFLSRMFLLLFLVLQINVSHLLRLLAALGLRMVLGSRELYIFMESSSSTGQLSQGASCSRVLEVSLLSSFILASTQVGQPWTNFKMAS